MEGAIPVWTFALADALLEKRVFMQAGANTTYVMYRLVRASAPIKLSIKALVNYGEEHCTTAAGDRPMDIAPVAHGLRVTAFDGAAPFYLLSASAKAQPAHDWYRNFDLSAERARGLPDHTDHLFAGEFSATLAPGESLTMVASTAATPSLDGEAALSTRQKEGRALLECFFTENIGMRQRLRRQFSNSCSPRINSSRRGRSMAHQMRGRFWRDIPGLATGDATPWLRFRDFAWQPGVHGSRVTSCKPSRGLSAKECFPITFRAPGEAPQYNTVDAALWYFEAVREYFDATSDIGLLRELYPVLAGIVDAMWAARAITFTSIRRTGCSMPENLACNSPGWTRKSAIA